MSNPVVIIGGGLTGVIAAKTLKDNGIENVLIVEKSRSVGGKMATRRIEEGRLDHGAQFFTVRSEYFKQTVEHWEMEGLIDHWFGKANYRYTSKNGMNTLVKHLAKSLPVKLNTKIDSINSEKDYYSLRTDENEELKACGVIMTPPVPQSLDILRNIAINKRVIKQLEHIKYNPCFVLLLLLNKNSNIPAPGHLTDSLPEGLERIVDHQQKGISDLCTISIYSTGEWAKENFNQTDDRIKSMILEKVAPYFSENNIKDVQVKRWKYAEATEIYSSSFLDTDQSIPLFIAGDAFLNEDDTSKRPRVESAFLSGVAAANEMMKRI